MTDTIADPWTWSEEIWRAKLAYAAAGRSLAPARWKDGASWAVALSFDSDHETFELRNGGASVVRLSQGVYGARRGTGRVLDVLERAGVPASFFMPAVSALVHPEEVKAVVSAGHELAIHGWIHESNLQLDQATERELSFRAADTLERMSGTRPVGLRTASWDFSPHTLSILREMGMLYDSSLMADDEPYELLDGGEPTGIIEIPVEWIRTDAPYMAMDRRVNARPYGGPAMVLEIFLREMERAHAEGGLFQLTLHQHHLGHRSRIFVLEEVISAARALGGAWFATHADIARYCAWQMGKGPSSRISPALFPENTARARRD